MTSDTASSTAAESAAPTGGRLTTRVRTARALLEPERPVVPAPRSADGVVPVPVFAQTAPPAQIVRALEGLTTDLAAVEDEPVEPGAQALDRALTLLAAGVPEEGWSLAEGLHPDTLAEASALAGTVHDTAAALLERLDAADRSASAVEIDAVVTTLRVARMVLDLESFALERR